MADNLRPTRRGERPLQPGSCHFGVRCPNDSCRSASARCSATGWNARFSRCCMHGERQSLVRIPRNNTLGVVVLIATSGHAPDQPKHGLEFVPAVFALVLLIDGVRAYRTSAHRHVQRVACRAAHHTSLNGTPSPCIGRQHDRLSRLARLVLPSLTTARPGLTILRSAFLTLTAMIVVIDSDDASLCPHANQPVSTGVSRR